MSAVEEQIRRARRRLTRNVLAERLCWGLLLAAGAWALTIVVVRLLALELPLWHGAWLVAATSLCIGLLATALARPTALAAAVTLDSATGLKERLSTALQLQGRTDPFARAAVGDAETKALGVHVPAHIRYRPPSLWPWSAATVTAALLLAAFMPSVDLFAADDNAEERVPRAMVEAEHQAIKVELEKQLNKIKELADDQPDLKDLVKDLQPLEMPEDPTVTPADIRREAVKRIDDVKDKLKRELETMDADALNETKRMLGRLNRPGAQPEGDKLSKALAEGDFAEAKRALEETLKELKEAAANSDDPAAQQKLAEMERKLERLSDQLAKLSDTVQLQKDLANKAGLSEEEARKLLEQLAKLDPKQLQKELQKQLGDKGLSPEQIQQLAKKIQQNQQARKACQSMSKALSKASQGCQACNSPGGGSGASQAAGALSDALSQLSDLEMAEQLMSELEAQLSDLGNLRDDVCQGGMCPGNGTGPRSGRIGSQGPGYGLGLGARIGKQRTPYKTDPTKAKTRFEGGSIIGQMLVDGAQVRGEATADVLDAAEAEVRDALDAIERDEIPRQYDRVLREYFERLAGLVRDRQAEVQKEPDDAKSE